MASTYAYTTIAALELFHGGIDYEATFSNYTDSVVEAQITQAERWVNTFCIQTFTGSIPDGVVYATLYMSRHFMNVLMLDDGFLEELPRTYEKVVKKCNEALKNNKVSIPYTNSIGDYDLRVLRG